MSVRNLVQVFFFGMVFAVGTVVVQASTTLYWNPGSDGTNTGGNGTWQGATGLCWSTATSGGTNQAWSNDDYDDAIFNGLTTSTRSYVTVSGVVNVRNITLTNSTYYNRYRFTGGTINLSGGLYGGSSAEVYSMISGSNGLLVSSGSFLLYGSQKVYTGDTTVNGSGTLGIGVSNVLPTASRLVVNGGFNIQNSAQVIAGLSGSGCVYNSSNDASLGILTVNVGNGITETFSGKVGHNNFNAWGANMSFLKTGAGTEILSGANIYTGTTTISDGVLSVNSIANGGLTPTITTTSGSAIVTASSTAGLIVGQSVACGKVPTARTIASIDSETQFTLDSSSGVTSGTSQNSVIGTLSALGIATSGASNLVFNGGILQYTGDTTVSDRAFTIAAGKTAIIDVVGNSLTLAGATGNATNGALTKIGNGKLVLSGSSTYTGSTTVNVGTLQIGNGTAAASIGATANLYVSNGAGVEIKNNSSVGTTGAFVIGNSGSSGSSLSTLTISGGTLNQTGSAQSMVGGNTGAPGKLAVSGGAINITTTGTTTGDGNPVLGIGGISYAGTGSVEQSGGTITIQSSSTEPRFNGLGIGTYAGSTGSYAMSAGELNVGQYVDDATDGDTEMNMFVGYKGRGTFTQTGGVVNVSRKLTIGANAGVSSVYDMSTGTGVLNATHYTETIVSNGGTDSLLVGDQSTVNVSGFRMGRGNGSGTITITGGEVNVLGATGIYTSGTGTVNLAGGVLDLHGNHVKSLTAFNFSAGELANANVDFSLTQTGGIFKAGYTTTWSSDYSSSTTALGNTITGDYALGSAATLALDVGTSACDKLTVGGAATLDGTISILLMDGYTAAAGDSFDILSFSTFSGAPTWDLAALGDGLTWNTSSFASTGVISIMAIPEPATIVILANAFICLAVYAWRRRMRIGVC